MAGAVGANGIQIEMAKREERETNQARLMCDAIRDRAH